MKKCIAEIAPAFTTKRMIDDYQSRFYTKLGERSGLLKQDNYKLVDELVSWKQQVADTWDQIYVESVELDKPNEAFTFGEVFNATIKVDLKGLKPEDIGFEFIVSEQREMEERQVVDC